MTATQTRMRRGTATQCDAMTPAADELISDTTNKRYRKGDGTTPGGVHLPNAFDIQKLAFNSGTVGGTGDAITITEDVPPLALSKYLSVTFVAGATNTGPATLNLNGLGVKNIKKITAGALADLAAGDIVAGGMYTATYDTVQWQLQTLYNSGLITVKQADISTSIGTVSATGTFVTLPGGEYGFYPQLKNSLASRGAIGVMAAGSNSFVTGITLGGTGSVASTELGVNASYIYPRMPGTWIISASAQQRYVNSSPPFDLGDGEVAGFFFALVNPAGEMVSHYAADVPPWGYNGPTKIRADFINPATGEKYRKVRKNNDFERTMNGQRPKETLELITNEIKNRDMKLIPHPFGDIAAGHTVALIDPMEDKIRRMIDYQNEGGADEVIEQIARGLIVIDNQKVVRKGPKGVAIHKMKYKFTGSK